MAHIFYVHITCVVLEMVAAMSLPVDRGVVAVTGARGLIGHHIVNQLLQDGYFVRALSRTPRVMVEHPRLQVVVGDINDESKVKALVDGVCAVFHCAAELHDESKMHDVNVLGTVTLLNQLQASSMLEYFCYLSSAGVVGPGVSKLVDEDSHCFPNNVYEKTKYTAERLVLDANLGVNVCVLRPANVFDAVHTGIAKLALRNTWKDKLLVWFRGNEGAHVVHAKDVAAAALYFMNKKLEKDEVFFLSYDQDSRNTVKGIYTYIRTLITGKRVRVRSVPCTIPYWFRVLRLGKSLHGNARFSEEKLRKYGFDFPMGFEIALNDVVSGES